MPTVQHLEQIRAFIDTYWYQVQKILRKDYNWDLEHSDARIAEAISDIETMEPDAQVIFYHAEPHDVAKDFAAAETDQYQQAGMVVADGHIGKTR